MRFVFVLMFVGIGQMDIKFHAGDAGFLLARNMQMITAEFQFLQLAFQLAGIRAEVNQRADEHVAADAAENVEIKRFHMLSVAAVCDRRIINQISRHEFLPERANPSSLLPNRLEHNFQPHKATFQSMIHWSAGCDQKSPFANAAMARHYFSIPWTENFSSF